MGKKEFAEVFAPSASEVKRRRDKHRKAMWSWMAVVIGLTASAMLCLHLLLDTPGEATARILIARVALVGVILETLALITAVLATYYHIKKMDYFEHQLDDTYILFPNWERAIDR